MRNTDINKYTDEYKNKKSETNVIVTESAKGFFTTVWGVASTVLLVLLISIVILGISVLIYLFQLSSEPTGIDLNATKLQLTSVIYVNDENGKPVEYEKLHSTENRVWVDYKDIPKDMIDAMVAIEDKRFWEHNGVDFIRTGGAVVSLLTGSDSYGGSTLTQQLIKNITDDNDVSINRKLREIFRAINLEREYTKTQIIEAYLNIVNFGAGCRGAQSAANVYFGKDIEKCSIAQCAAIAGITQNPSAFDPLEYPKNNKERREIVIDAMYDQDMITKKEYKEALKESDKMKFIGYVEEEKEELEEEEIPNWYIDMLFQDVQKDLAKVYNISEETASLRMYTEGLKIYCAMDLEMQEYAEDYVLNVETPNDPNLQMAFMMMEPNGRIIASVGSRNKKDGMLLWDRANDSILQPGSSIKPAFVYPLAIESGLYNYSSYVNDKPMDKYYYVDGMWRPGPYNVGAYQGEILLPYALERSLNAAVVQIMNELGPKTAYDQAINKTGFKNLTNQDAENLGALSIGGMNGGVTVREMVGSYQFMGNGGRFYDTHSYYYVTDQDDNVILDNRELIPIQAYSEETATIINRLLHYNVITGEHTNADSAAVSGWDIIGKTGTTDQDKDHWFIGMSPYAILGTWVGYDTPSSIMGSSYLAEDTFRILMTHYLEDKEHKEFALSPNVEEAYFCTKSGLLATDSCYSKEIGYYDKNNMPDYCYGYHNGVDYGTTAPEVETQPQTTVESGTQATEPEQTDPPQTDPPQTDPPQTDPPQVTDPVVQGEE